MKERACLQCKFITDEQVCPNCGSKDFTTDWSGVIFVLDPEKSSLAKLVGAKKVGRYAIKAR